MKHFRLEEFDSPDAPGSGAGMDLHFLELLDRIREDAAIPFVITSGFRTVRHNAGLKGSTPNSAHLSGMAADIRALTGRDKWLIVAAGIRNGIRRIGIGRNFAPVDNDASLPDPTIWIY